MLVTLSGIVMFVSPVQSRKAYDGMIFTLSPIFTVTILEQLLKIEETPECVIVHAVAFQLTVVSPVQLRKAPLFNPVRTRDTVRTLYKHNIIF